MTLLILFDDFGNHLDNSLPISKRLILMTDINYQRRSGHQWNVVDLTKTGSTPHV